MLSRLADQAKLALEGAVQLQDLLQHPEAGRARMLAELQAEGAQRSRDLLEEIHGAFTTPVGRGDLLSLVARLSDLLRAAADAAQRFALYELPAATPEARELARILVAASGWVKEAIDAVRDGRTDRLRPLCTEIERLETESDELLRLSVARLLRERPDPNAILRWTDLYQSIDRGTNRCEQIAHVLDSVAGDFCGRR